MYKRHLVPAPIAIVIGALFFIFGLINLFINVMYIRENKQFIANADKVSAECIALEDGDSSSNFRIKAVVEYFYKGEKYENVIINSYGQFILSGYTLELYVNPDYPAQCTIEYKWTEGIGETYTLFTFSGLAGGLCMLIIGISRIKRGIIW